MNKKRIILIGGGGQCKSCIDVIEQTNKFDIIGIIDLADKAGQTILGYPIIGTDEQTPSFKNKTDYFLLTIGQIELPKTLDDRGNLTFIEGENENKMGSEFFY